MKYFQIIAAVMNSAVVAFAIYKWWEARREERLILELIQKVLDRLGVDTK